MTRKEAIIMLIRLKDRINFEVTDSQKKMDALNMAIKALEQESILDKIRAEIEKAVWEDSIYSFDGSDEVRIPRLDPEDVFEIIDKYKAESEVQE